MILSRDLRIAILVDQGVEQENLTSCRQYLEESGATVDIISSKATEVKTWNNCEWGNRIKVDKLIRQVDPEEYDGLLIPGGLMHAELLRLNIEVINFIKYLGAAGKIIGSMGHATQVLIDAGLVDGKKVTSNESIKADLINAGSIWMNEAIVIDNGLITFNSSDSETCVKHFLEELKTGIHQRTETII